MEKATSSISKMAFKLARGAPCSSHLFQFFYASLLDRYSLVASILVIVVFCKSWVTYKIGDSFYRMPIALSFILIGFFIWVAENIATYLGAWQYPNQTDAWSLVHLGKVSSWLLLVIVSFLIVATLKQVKDERVG